MRDELMLGCVHTHVVQGTLELNQYALRLAGVFAFFFALIGGPVAYQTFDPYSQVCTVRAPAQPGCLGRLPASPCRGHAGLAMPRHLCTFAPLLLWRPCVPFVLRTHLPAEWGQLHMHPGVEVAVPPTPLKH